MSDFLKNPNLPNGKVKTLICGTDDKEILDFFRLKGIEIIKPTPNPHIDFSVSSHADMSVLHLGGDLIIMDKEQNELKNALSEIGMTVFETKTPIKGSYPNDVKLNFCIVGDSVVGNFKYADENLLKHTAGKRQIAVKQGYCKCSVLTVSEKAVITDDESIHRKMLQSGFDSLLIGKGDVSLPGHEYGFIGGASGKVSAFEVVFFGNIEKHRDFSAIRDFLRRYNCSYLCTDEGKLRDIGGIVPILEN